MTVLERASRVIPGGVNSPVRAFRGVGGDPIFIDSADGAWLIDHRGKRYVDLIGGYGPMILGHGHPAVLDAVHRTLDRGTVFGAPTTAEIDLAETICGAVESIESVRLVCSGTEATMSALRLARAATGRDKMVKLVGCYHGHGDAFLVAAGSGAATIGVPSSPGVPDVVTADTMVAPYNDSDAVTELFDASGDQIAAVFVEPFAGNMGLVPPRPGYLETLRSLCDAHGALLVFDEVMTGFRVAWAGAQSIVDVRPDLTTLGKVIGGGLPVGAYGGRRDLMEQIAPAGPVYQAGTLSGNPLAVAAGLATLEQLAGDDFSLYGRLETASADLADGLGQAAARHGIPFTINRQGSMVGIFFSAGPIEASADVDASDRDRFSRVFHRLLEAGVHLPPSPYETLFVSAAHGEAEVAHVVDAFDRALGAE